MVIVVVLVVVGGLKIAHRSNFGHLIAYDNIFALSIKSPVNQ